LTISPEFNCWKRIGTLRRISLNAIEKVEDAGESYGAKQGSKQYGLGYR